MQRLLFIILSLCIALPLMAESHSRPRVVISTDIGGTDPDDFQSMVHLLLYADVLEIEGLISSAFGDGRKEHILEVINEYEKDYPNLVTHSPRYPTADALRAITKQGETEIAPLEGYRQATEGSRWLIERARQKDPRPLHVLVWGGLEDVAQALHDAPDILPKLRVYYIGGPNKKWTPSSYHYIATQHPTLWMIENNASYRGWFVGGDQSGDWGNDSFVTKYVAPHGAMGNYFASTLEGVIKMGDTPAVAWLLHGDPSNPAHPGWGGQFVRAWTRHHTVFEGLTTEQDRIEEFSIAELVLPLPKKLPKNTHVIMDVENQSLVGTIDEDKRHVRFFFSPKATAVFTYQLRSNLTEYNGKTGALTAIATPPNAAQFPDSRWPNWWVDNPAPEFAEGPHIGAKTVSRWRQDFLRDFAARMQRTSTPAAN